MIGNRQLPLAVGLRDDSTFDNFLPAANGEALAAVRELVAGRQPFVYVCGEPGSGRSHLLEAAIHAKAAAGLPVFYLNLAGPDLPPPAILDGIGDLVALVCLDGVDAVAGDAAWEQAVFHIFNAIRSAGGALMVSAGAVPGAVGWQLPDLASRMASGLVVRLVVPSDEQRLAILAFRAARRGLELSPETGRYLLARVNRRLDELVGLLDRLDREALTHQRRLSIPFVRQVLQSAE